VEPIWREYPRYRMTVPGPADEPWSPVGPDLEPPSDDHQPEPDQATEPERRPARA
jgi:hypothetical protein